MDESSETNNLEADYKAEDPSILTEEELKAIADHHGLSIEKVKTLAKQMTKNRRDINIPEE